MSRPTEEVEQIEAEVPKFPGNFYTARGGRRRIVFPNATLLDGAAMADALNKVTNFGGLAQKDDDGESNVYLGPHTPGQFARRSWADLINRSIGPAGLNNQEYGPLASLSDEESLPFLMTEWCALLNVRRWRFAGHIGPMAFDVTAWAGTVTTYNPDPVLTGDWITPAEARAAWSTQVSWSDFDSEESLAVSFIVNIGGAGVPTRIWDAYNEAPSRLQVLPRLRIDINHAGSNLVRTPGAFINVGAGELDENVLWLGRPVRTIVGDIDPLPDYSMTITSDLDWTSADAWNGVGA